MDPEVAGEAPPPLKKKGLPTWAKILIAAFLVLAAGISVLGYYFVRGMTAHRGYWRNVSGHHSLSQAVRMYYGDHEALPKSLTGKGFMGEYILEIPELDLREVERGLSREVETYSFSDKDGRLVPEKLKDSGHWAYDPSSGLVVIDCKDLNRHKKIPYYLIGQPRD